MPRVGIEQVEVILSENSLYLKTKTEISILYIMKNTFDVDDRFFLFKTLCSQKRIHQIKIFLMENYKTRYNTFS